MKELKEIILEFLRRENSFISLEENYKKLKNKDGKPYLSLEDITVEYGGLGDFLDFVKENYSNGTFTFKIIKDNKQSIIRRVRMNTEENTKSEEMNEVEEKAPQETKIAYPQNNTPVPYPVQTNTTPINYMPQTTYMGNPNFGLGFVQVPQATIIDGAVKSERFEDYKNRVEELKEELKDLKSENRILKEKNATLEIELKSKDRETELSLKQAELERKGFFDSEAGKEVIKGLSGAIPAIAGHFMNGGTETMETSAGLGSAETSQIKKAFIEMVLNPEIDDNMVSEWYNLIYSKYGETEQQGS